jgi:uncharacterized protein (TIGR00156 family)
MKLLSGLILALGILTTPASAQFTGPSAGSGEITVAEAQNARLGSYVTLTGNIVAHQRESYYIFQDATGQIRAEIERRIWRGREVTPSTPVRVLAEVDRGFRGRYLDVQRLDILE